MKVLIAQPNDYPHNLTKKLIKYFDENKNIKKAYLACIQYPSPKIGMKIIIGLDTSNSIDIIAKEFENFLNKETDLSHQFSFVNANNDPFKNYFLKIKPFYEIKSDN